MASAPSIIGDTSDMADPELFMWARGKQPPWKKILASLARTYTDGAQIFQIGCKDCDDCDLAIVVAERTMTSAQVKKWFLQARNETG